MSRLGLYAAVALGLTLTAGPARAQNWAPGKRFDESATRVLDGIGRITGKTQYGYTDGICFLTAFMLKGEDVRFTRDFDGGTKYAVVGGGDNGVKDLDIFILDKDGKEVVKDTLTDATAVVEFTPPRAGRYTIKVVMHDAGQNGGFGTVGVLKDGGFSVPVRNQQAALKGLVAQCNLVDRQVKEQVYFNSGANQWAVYGSIVRSGGDLTIDNITPGGGRRVWVGAGDTTAQDIDLYLMNDGGKVLVKDEDDDAVPLIDYRTTPGDRYSLRIKNVRSNGPCLILTATLNLN